ncbi:MAG TPA: prolyl oligopeptidase family serine peptidase [Candidatus Acidoferrum sp.]|nr:prolyl oligopeptidase family serine peptidase [Candidatus Acidoferrum sp.]
MPNPIKSLFQFTLALAVCLPLVGRADDAHPNPGGGRRGGGPPTGVYKSVVTPHWFANNVLVRDPATGLTNISAKFPLDTKFWYRNTLRGGASEFVLVDAEKGIRQAAFDHEKLAAALSKAAGQEFKGDHLPFTNIEFSDDAKSIKFDAADKSWNCDLNSYQCTPQATPAKSASLAPAAPPALASAGSEDAADAFGLLDPAPACDESDPAPQQQDQAQGPGGGGRGGRGGGRGFGGGGGGRSPDGNWSVTVSNYNLYLRALPDGQAEQITQDGREGDGYGRLQWSPDSKTLTAWQTVPGDRKLVYLVQSSPANAGRTVETSRPYAQAGDKFTTYELSIFDVAGHKLIKPQVDKFEHEYETPSIHWSLDRSHFTYQLEDRGHQRMRLIEVDARTGAVRNLVDEQTKTFIWTAHTEGPQRYGFMIFWYLDKTDEVLHQSEKDGWRHIYLVDPKTGQSKQVTKGQWIIRGISTVDEDQRQIWFAASGMYPDQDPYFIHYGRVNFDGSGLVMLTEGNGSHSVLYSPDRKYIIDTYSRVDMPPVNELRRVSDGKLVCKLEESDITELTDRGFKTPEVFSAKGRDGVTDIWGIITRPANFDPNKKYPVLENIYNGPQDSYVAKSFSAGGGRGGGYGALGFIVVQCDAMGTANRSKAFHDVCWHNLGDGGFPDRIAWIKAAAEKYPSLDTNRVGIFGTSAGGQNAAAAVIFHPQFYKVAVANSGCHDNRIDKASWNEQWMGYMPPDKIWLKSDDNWFSKSSNIDNAAKLGGKLLLIVGELDHNVPPESTFRLVNELILANKDFDLLVVPNADHGAGSRPTGLTVPFNGAYAGRRTQDFLVQNLMGKMPPNRNAGEKDPVNSAN